MKSLKWCLLCLTALVAAGVVFAIFVQRSSRNSRLPANEQRFHVRGEVRGLDHDARQIRIKHEEIPNYMAAMTMPFDVHDDSLLRGIKAGDEVGFELVVTK